MRFVNYRYDGNVRLGAVEDGYVIDLNQAYQCLLESKGRLRAKQIAEAFIPSDMIGFLQGDKESFGMAKEAVAYARTESQVFGKRIILPLEDVQLEAPVLAPGKIICVGHNYREHILEMKREIPAYPVVFAKFSNTIIGPQKEIPYWPISEQLDYEAEFAFVIGKRARNVTSQDALDYVAGYTIVNDVTYRDIQCRTLQWLQGKTVEGTAPMGPWLVSKDEIPDPAGLEVVLTVNGEERQRSNTRNLVFTVPFLVEYLSGLMTLETGDVICTGTPGGVGDAMQPPTYLQDGDVVRIEISSIGALENRVKRQSEGAFT
ncbi:fumarylacetoacetate hydrolase family protein [Brevibacillus sp. NRS-1366]|uniref:fumarylacetoacetate hydrolase family protein n=1 Tax=Brevibacillus sp. NRS-1366 TaxID=3233899 RepID=UPI003D247F4C